MGLSSLILYFSYVRHILHPHFLAVLDEFCFFVEALRKVIAYFLLVDVVKQCFQFWIDVIDGVLRIQKNDNNLPERLFGMTTKTNYTLKD